MLTGYKSYVCAAIAAIIGIDQGLIAAGVHGVPAIPGYVIMLLSAFGLYSVRSAISTSSAATAQAIVAQIAPISSAAATPIAITLTNNTDKPQEIRSPDNLTFVRKDR